MQKDLTKNTPGSLGGALNSGNKFISHLMVFLNAAKPLGAEITLGNKTVKTIAGGLQSFFTGGSNTTIQSAGGEASTAQVGLSDELAKFFSGTGGTVQSISDWSSRVNPYGSIGEKQGMTNGALQLFGGQLVPFLSQVSNTMGISTQDVWSKYITPEAQQTLSQFRDQGYNLGEMTQYVPYSDKNAFRNNGGTQQQWDGAVDTMSKTIDPKTGQPIPLTDENILQWINMNNH
jgi:hypothetical protein